MSSNDEREIARITAYEHVTEDHGLIMLRVECTTASGVQSFAPVFSPKRPEDLGLAMFMWSELRGWSRVGRVLYVLRDRGIIVGFEALEIDGRERWTRAECLERWRALCAKHPPSFGVCE